MFEGGKCCGGCNCGKKVVGGKGGCGCGKVGGKGGCGSC